MTLALDSVQVRRGRRTVVTGVNWNLGVGLHALLGPNGAGKSTLFGAIVTLLTPSAGTISVMGETAVAQRRRITSFLPQDNLRRSRLSVQDHLAQMAWLRRIPRAQRDDEVARVMEALQVQDQAQRRVRALSGGLRRRVGIAGALLGSPDLVVLDEPSAGLDPEQRIRLSELIQQIAQDTTVLVSTHIMEDVLLVADTVTVMNQGRFVHHGSLDDVAPYAGQVAQ